MKKLRKMKRIFGISVMILSILISQIPITAQADSSSDFVIEDGVLVDYVGNGGDVVIPNTVTAIDSGAFFYNVSGDNSAHVGDKVTSITIPASVTQIGCSRSSGSNGPYDTVDHYLLRLDNLQMIYVDENNPVYSSIDGILYNKGKTIIYQMPKAYKHTSTEWSIPEGVEDSSGFGELQLNGVEILNVPSSFRFDNFYYTQADRLKEIRVADNNPGYTSVDGVVYNKEITKVVCWPTQKVFNGFPTSVSVIGKHAFLISKLVEMNEIPSQIVSIEKGGVSGIKFPEQLTVPNTVKTLDTHALSGINSKIIILEEGITEIPPYCFSECQNLEELYVPRSVITTNFSNCFFLSEPVIKCYSESVAHKDAQTWNLKFDLLDTEEDESLSEITDKIATIQNSHTKLTETNLISATVTNSIQEPILKISDAQNNVLSTYYQSLEGEYDVYYIHLDMVNNNGEGIDYSECKFVIPFPEGWWTEAQGYYDVHIVRDLDGSIGYGNGYQIVRENGRTFINFRLHSLGRSSYDLAIMWDKAGYNSSGETGATKEAIIENSSSVLPNPSLVSAIVEGTSQEPILRITNSTKDVFKPYVQSLPNTNNYAYVNMSIDLVNGSGEPIKDFSSCKITLPLPSKWQNQDAKFWVVVQEADNTYSELSTSVIHKDGVKCVQFTTNHFSEYAIINEQPKKNDDTNTGGTDTNKPTDGNQNTGGQDNNNQTGGTGNNQNQNTGNQGGSQNNQNQNTGGTQTTTQNNNSNTQSNVSTVNNQGNQEVATTVRSVNSVNQNSGNSGSDLSYMPKTGIEDLLFLRDTFCYGGFLFGLYIILLSFKKTA